MLNVEVYRQQMRMMGEPIRWFKGFPCSCYQPLTNSFDPTCTRCRDGVEYIEQTLASTVRVLVANLKKRYEHPEFGLLEVGELTITTMPDEVLLAFKDRVVLMGRTAVAREAVTRLADLPGGIEQSDPVLEGYPVALLSVVFEGHEYTIGTDCALVNNRISWLADGDAPNAGEHYAVEYQYRPHFVYLAMDETPPRPVPLMGSVLTPQRGFLLKRLPGDS